jgi:hypothetical protein
MTTEHTALSDHHRSRLHGPLQIIGRTWCSRRCARELAAAPEIVSATAILAATTTTTTGSVRIGQVRHHHIGNAVSLWCRAPFELAPAVVDQPI